MQGHDACFFSHYCICHNQELCCSSLYGYHRKGIPAHTNLMQGACTYCPSPICYSTSVWLSGAAYGLHHSPSDTICYGVSSTLSSLAFSVPLLLLPTGSQCACVRLQCGSLVRLALVSSVSLWWADRAALSGSAFSLRHPALRALRCYALPRPCFFFIAT